jgi:hypothetical protein
MTHFPMLTRIASYVIVLVLGTALMVTAQSSVQVTTTATQTLTNKTLTAPTITGPSITGTVAGGASYTAPTLTSPILSGTIGGSGIWASPGAFGGTSPSTIKGTTITATSAVVVGTCQLKFGTSSPESVVTAPVCSTFFRTDGGTGTTVYLKESGAGNTGWVAVTAGGGSVSWTAPGTIGSVTPNTGAFTTLSVTGQFTSTLSTGTAPLVIASTTKVSNLNVDLLDGGDWAAPIAIGTSTPAAITGTTITATSCFVVIAQKICSGAGSPEGVVTAPIGSTYQRSDGSSGTTLYSKEAGSGNTGWAALAPSTINWGAAGAIGATTPNTAIFTTMYATRLQFGMSTPTYGATVSLDASLGNFFVITATNNTGFTISNPTNLGTGQPIIVQVKNTSGGALGTITWDTLYKMATFTKPATGFNRTATFIYNGTTLVEVNCSPEVPN